MFSPEAIDLQTGRIQFPAQVYQISNWWLRDDEVASLLIAEMMKIYQSLLVTQLSLL